MSFLSKLPYIIATILLLIGGALFFAFPIRNIFEYYIRYEPNRIYLIIPVLAGSYLIPMYLFVMSTFFLASFVDPGIYPRESTKEEDDFRQPLYRGAVVNGVSVRMKWCETCNFYRPPRTSHCSICDNCVENFDHHCPWVDNCIGKRNYKYFFMFVNSLSFFILNGFGWTAFSIILHSQNRQLIHATLDFILIGVGVIGFIPVVGLAGFHCGLVCMGRTTNEHVTGKYRSTGNPFDMGCKRNCTAVLCAPKTPRYANYIAKSYRPHRLPHSGRSTISPPTIPVYEEVDSARRAAEEEMCNTNNIAAIPLNVLSSNGASARDPLQANIIHSPPPDELQYADALMAEFTV